MINKSLVYITCETYTLCGISTSFPVLSPNQRQVAHALLTRPPLSLINASRRINQLSSVRLECVRHAASVHPEPGSNSLKNYNLATEVVKSFSLSQILGNLLLSSKKLLFSTDSFALFSARNSVVQFSKTDARPTHLLIGQLFYYTHFLPICQALFESFSKKFQKAQPHGVFQSFFDFFEYFYHFVQTVQKAAFLPPFLSHLLTVARARPHSLQGAH